MLQHFTSHYLASVSITYVVRQRAILNNIIIQLHVTCSLVCKAVFNNVQQPISLVPRRRAIQYISEFPFPGQHSRNDTELENHMFSGLTLEVLVATINAQWEGMGDVGLARYEPALLPPCPTIKVLSYSN